MARKRVSKEALPAGVTPPISNSRFGWCTTGHHESCRISYVDWNKVEQFCSCKCHKEK